MVLRQLSVLNYRNLEAAQITFPDGVTAVTGGNAQGKTNLLEAIYLVLTGVLTASRLEAVVRIGESEAHVGAVLEREDGSSRMEVGLAPGRRVARVDGGRVRVADLARHAAAVWVRPEDADLVHGSPSGRRAFTDALLSRMSARYAHALSLYERVLAQRNAALKHHESAAGLQVWDDRLVELAGEIMPVRRRAVGRLAGLAATAYQELAGEGKVLTVSLVESAPIEDLAGVLAERRNEELARGTTVVGPHRDDFALTLGGLAANDYASRGEARTVALALRKAEYDLLSGKFGEPPVLLVDDYSAELDPHRRRYLLDLAGRTPQAIVTGTDTPPGANRCFGIRAGQLLGTDGEREVAGG
jgi:DNA replication and repair protein RecF